MHTASTTTYHCTIHPPKQILETLGLSSPCIPRSPPKPTLEAAPDAAAQCKGVCPCKSVRLTSPSAASKHRSTSRCPAAAAECLEIRRVTEPLVVTSSRLKQCLVLVEVFPLEDLKKGIYRGKESIRIKESITSAGPI